MSESTLLFHGDIVPDTWSELEEGAPVPAEGDIFVSLDRFDAERELFRSRMGRTGVRLSPGHTGRELIADFEGIDAIAIEFPKFTDGRGYTIARRLREQLGWAKQLRAVGDVLPDQVLFMRRCGFDALKLRADKSPQVAQRALRAFSVAYQGAADDPRPIYRRESPAGAALKSARAS